MPTLPFIKKGHPAPTYEGGMAFFIYGNVGISLPLLVKVELLEQVFHSHFIAHDAVVNAVCHSKRGDKGGDQ